MTSPQTIGVMICTAHRPNMLRRCIDSILAQQVPEGWRFEICVVENDAEPHSRHVVEVAADLGTAPIHYYQEPRRGIPIARNRTLEVALARGYDWIALIDDDELAHPDWLARHIEAALRYKADVVCGPVQRKYEQLPPEWWKALKPAATLAGAVLEEAPTNNTFLSSALIRPDGSDLSFDERLTFGYEDIDFFRRAHAKGHRIVWMPDAIVEEEIPASRVEPERLLSRVEMQATSLTYTTILRHGFWTAFARFAPKAARRIVSGFVMIIIGRMLGLIDKRQGRNTYYRARTKVARGIGNARGLMRSFGDYYGRIDGN
ncbi:GT2 family glycosyltransferase [Breoghania corrubedonensis]|uniref:GT2 family glycosyltransferase n=1 Tax=Breoghania corrubedonensis TaxID=665038 RepID=A0A2T5V9K9_9HYPH|nr:glycosyltransferase family A protein [Breoghania corrubedonensis]PTW60424.1 GT2 family glycosyltransferase [Breoghania corrubedonensis]